MSCPSVRRINERQVLGDQTHSTAQTVVWYSDDGVILIRGASSLVLPWESVPAVIGALRAGLKIERETP